LKGPGRQIVQLDDPVIVRHPEKRVREHGQVRGHPGMDIALDVKDGLGLRENLCLFHPLNGHADVEAGVHDGQGMNVVQGRVAVENLQWLPGHEADDVGNVDAPLLVQRDGGLGSRIRARDAVFHEHERVDERTVRADFHRLTEEWLGLMRFRAVGIGARLQLEWRRRLSVENHFCDDSSRSRGSLKRGSRRV
jgi:hypothetical protein